MTWKNMKIRSPNSGEEDRCLVFKALLKSLFFVNVIIQYQIPVSFKMTVTKLQFPCLKKINPWDPGFLGSLALKIEILKEILQLNFFKGNDWEIQRQRIDIYILLSLIILGELCLKVKIEWFIASST